MEMDDVFMKDDCLKGGHAEKLITPLLSGPNICYPFPGLSVNVMCMDCVCLCVSGWKEKEKEKKAQTLNLLSKWDK